MEKGFIGGQEVVGKEGREEVGDKLRVIRKHCTHVWKRQGTNSLKMSPVSQRLPPGVKTINSSIVLPLDSHWYLASFRHIIKMAKFHYWGVSIVTSRRSTEILPSNHNMMSSVKKGANMNDFSEMRYIDVQKPRPGDFHRDEEGPTHLTVERRYW